MIEKDFDPWFGGNEEYAYLKSLKKLKGQHVIPLIILSEDFSGGRVVTRGGISPIILALWGKEQRVALTNMKESIYMGSVRLLAHALLCACNGDVKLAIRYLEYDNKMNPELAADIKNYSNNKRETIEQSKKEGELVRELNRMHCNKPAEGK